MEWQIAEHRRPLHPAPHRPGMVHHFRQSHIHRILITQQHHPQTVASQDQVHPALVQQPRGRVITSRQANQPLSRRFRRHQGHPLPCQIFRHPGSGQLSVTQQRRLITNQEVEQRPDIHGKPRQNQRRTDRNQRLQHKPPQMQPRMRNGQGILLHHPRPGIQNIQIDRARRILRPAVRPAQPALNTPQGFQQCHWFQSTVQLRHRIQKRRSIRLTIDRSRLIGGRHGSDLPQSGQGPQRRMEMAEPVTDVGTERDSVSGQAGGGIGRSIHAGGKFRSF